MLAAATAIIGEWHQIITNKGLDDGMAKSTTSKSKDVTRVQAAGGSTFQIDLDQPGDALPAFASPDFDMANNSLAAKLRKQRGLA